ncbi:MAG: flagellar brake protein [Nitrospira sp.]|jgi:c-di-GMP-binding flagellar brake protein YcgR
MNDVTTTQPTPTSFLTVGLSLKLSFTVNGQKGMYGSTLLGWKDYAWLVCEWPLQVGHGAEIPRGTPCTVSYLYDGKLVGYRTEIRDMLSAPVPLLFIAFPLTVEEMHLRKHARVSSCEPIVLERVDGNTISGARSSAIVGGLLQNLSIGGCSVLVPHAPAWLRAGTTLRMEFELAGLGHVTNLTGLVKTSDAQQGNSTLGIEFRFQEMEYIEYRGWGGSVQQAIEQWTAQKATDQFPLQ